MHTTMLKVKEIARRYGVKSQVVLAWIAKGQLAAIDVKRPGAKRPSWRVEPAELQRFEEVRSNGGAVPALRRHRSPLAHGQGFRQFVSIHDGPPPGSAMPARGPSPLARAPR